MWHVLVTPTLPIPLNHWMQSHSNTELFLNWLNTFPSTLIISTIPILNMHLLVLITLYKCVHAYLEKYPDKMYNDVFPWTVKSVLNSPAHCFAHNPLFFCTRHSKSASNILHQRVLHQHVLHQGPRQLVLPSNKVFYNWVLYDKMCLRSQP